MTMRKYLVTIHEDGHVTALEYEEPREAATRDYNVGARDAYRRVVRRLNEEFLKYQDAAYRTDKASEARNFICRADECHHIANIVADMYPSL